MYRLYLVEFLFIALGLIAVFAAIRWPRQVLVKLPLAILSIPFRPFIFFASLCVGVSSELFRLIERKFNFNLSDGFWKFLYSKEQADSRTYRASTRLPMNFVDGEKLAYLGTHDPQRVIAKMNSELFESKFQDRELKITNDGAHWLVRFPSWISPFDYLLAVQFFGNHIGEKGCFGVFQSKQLEFIVFFEKWRGDNLVGFTNSRNRFSVNVFDDFSAGFHLKMNQDLRFETAWIASVLKNAPFKLINFLP